MNNKKVISSFVWKFLERCGAQLVALVVQIVLARMLSPDVYGTIALVTVFTTILNVFIDSGLGNALIQKKDADDIDFSTVFYFNVIVCGILYAGMFICSPLIAAFYNDASLIPIIRALSCTLLISGVKNIQQAYVSKTMQFKKFFFATLGGTLGAAILGIAFAYYGAGVWALVIQQLFNATVDTIILWITVEWRPKKVFSFSRLKSLFSYGWKLLVSAIIDTGYNELRQLIIGKIYSTAELAQYNRGQQFPAIIVTNINSSIDSVLLPTLSAQQDDKVKVRAMTRRAIKISTYIMAPLVMGLCAAAVPLIKLVLTDKWLPSVFFMRIFCVTFMFYPIHTANLNAIKAMGRSDLFLKLEIIKKIIGMGLIVSTMFISVKAMALSLLVSSLLSQIINSWPNKKLLNYSYIEQIKDILPGIILAIAMAAIIYPISLIGLPILLTLGIQIIVGMLFYLLISAVFKIDSFMYLVNIIRPYISKRRKKQ